MEAVALPKTYQCVFKQRMDERIFGPILINLEKRKDRLHESTLEFNKLNIQYILLKATESEDKAMACQDSHCRALELFLQTSETKTACFICEDDVMWNCNQEFLNANIRDFLENPKPQALCLGYSSREHYPYNNLFFKTTDNQTRTAYLIKRSLAADLLDLWRRLYTLRISGNYKTEPNWYYTLFHSIALQTTPEDIYRGDQAWKILQKTTQFLIPIKPLAKQRPSYSDIEQKKVNYET